MCFSVFFRIFTCEFLRELEPEEEARQAFDLKRTSEIITKSLN